MSDYLFAVDTKQKDFIVFNADYFNLTDEKIIPTDIKLVRFGIQNKTQLNELRSKAWSSNCKTFFVIEPEGIYLFNIYSEFCLLCLKHSNEFIKEYVNFPIKDLNKR